MLELQSISLGGNRLQGMLPEGWGTGKAPLKHLDSTFKGVIPNAKQT